MAGQPNVLVIMTDEERFAPPYESDRLAEFRSEHMAAREALRTRGVSLNRHYVASTACLPSRTSLFTGQYPSLHGVRNTNGLAKASTDPAMVWLDADGVPTMGDWFRQAGYETHYRGKWHISHADLTSTGSHSSFLTNTRDGVALPQAVAAYEATDRLDPFGFSGWIGPDPHGPDPANTGVARDDLFADQVCGLLDDFAGRTDRPPWLVVASLVNPHDIVFAGMGWSALGFDPVPDWVPEVPEAPSQSDSLEHRPKCQAEFRDVWSRMLYDQRPDGEYRRLYYYLLALVDRAIGRILDSLQRNGLEDDTIVVFTSDHGDVLGSHGGLVQKWYNAYDETIHVPLVISGPGLPEGRALDVPTSHVDLLPTLLGLAGSDPTGLSEGLSQSHIEVHDLPGRDLSDVIADANPGPTDGEVLQSCEPVYFMTEDQISRGLHNRGLLSGLQYEPVESPCAVESVIAHHRGTLYKLNHYYDPAAGPTDGSASHDWELHDLFADPEERTDLSRTSGAPIEELRDVLASERHAKRLEPRAWTASM